MPAEVQIVELLKLRVPGLLAVYVFGSQVLGNADASSDLDVAVLVSGYADPLLLWQLAHELHDVAGCRVDLLDFRAASTVMQSQILLTGERWWAKDVQAKLFEVAVLSDKTELDTARAGLIGDIYRQGRVYGR